MKLKQTGSVIVSEAQQAQMIGEYRLVQKLGKGNFGTVYLAEHLHQQAQVAIKVLQVQLARSEDLRGFFKETHTIMHLQHPHIMPLLDVGLNREDQPFLVMEYAPKGTLEEQHPKGSHVLLATITEYVDQIASALQYAHDRGIIHRDIKPANMLIRSDGTLLLSDFGISNIMERSTLTSMQMYAGTPAYMAPEQHKGHPCLASDQYALAVAVYEWISGIPPFDGDSFGLAFQHTMVRPPSLLKLCPTLFPQIEQVIFKALSKEPAQRFATVQEFAAAFYAAVQQASISQVNNKNPIFKSNEKLTLAPAASAATRTEPRITAQQPLSAEQVAEPKVVQIKITPAQMNKSLRRNLVLLSTGLLIGMLMLALVINRGGISLQKTRADSLPLLAVHATPTAAYPTPNVIHSGVYQFLNQDTVSHLVKKWTFQTTSPIYYSSPVTVDGVVYVGASDGHVYAIDERSGQQKWAFQTGSTVKSSPRVVDGVVYIGSDDHNFYALDAQSGKQKWAFQTGGVVESSPAIANGVAYFGSSDRNVYALDVQSGKQKWAFQTGSTVKSSPRVVDGVVYIGSDDHNFYALDARSGQMRWFFHTGNNVYSSPAVIDGVVYIGSMDNNVYALDARSGQMRWFFHTGNNVYSSPAVIGGVVYIGSDDHNFYALDAQSGKQKWAFQTGGVVESSPAIANGVAYFGSGDSKFYALDAGSGQVKWTFQTGDRVYSSPVVVNNAVYFGSLDHNVYAFALPASAQP